MKKIDENLGGTTPLSVILKFPSTKRNKDKVMMNLMNGMRIMKKMRINQKSVVY